MNERGTNMRMFDWKSHDIKIIFGDMNFRLVQELDLDHGLKLLEQEDIASLQFYDEFNTFHRDTQKKGNLRHYKEGTMTFKPTYKFKMNTNEYDINRVPAYTDRILFEQVHQLPQQNPLMCIFYGMADYDISDHKPITGLFEAKIKVQNREVK